MIARKADEYAEKGELKMCRNACFQAFSVKKGYHGLYLSDSHFT